MLKPAVSPTAPRLGKPHRARGARVRGTAPGGLPHPSIVIPRSYYRVSNGFGAAETAVIFATFVVSLAALPIAARLGWHVLYVPLLPLLGASSQKIALLMEEAAHGTLFTHPYANRLVGLVCGGLLGRNARRAAATNQDHLRHCGTVFEQIDAELPDPARISRWRLVTYFLVPLTGYTFFRALLARGGVLGNLIGRGGGDGNAGASTWQRLVLFLFVQAAVALVATDLGRFWLLALAYPVSAATLGGFFGRLRTFCEHVQIRGGCTVRSHAPNFFDRVFFYTLNANYHVEHHLYPRIPAASLRLVHRDLAHAGYFGEGMVSPSILRTVRRALDGAGPPAP